MCAWAPRRPDEGVRSPGTGVIGGYEPLHGWWKTNPCTLKVHKVLGRHPSNSPIYDFIKTTVRNKLLRKIMYFLKVEVVFKVKPLAIYAGSNGCEPPRKLIWGWWCTNGGLAGSVRDFQSSPFHMAPGKLGCTVTFPWDWLSLERTNLHTKKYIFHIQDTGNASSPEPKALHWALDTFPTVISMSIWHACNTFSVCVWYLCRNITCHSLCGSQRTVRWSWFSPSAR